MLLRSLLLIVLLVLSGYTVMSFAQSDGTGNALPIVSTGMVTAKRSVTLAIKIMGRIGQLDHDEGNVVRQGDVLLQLDSAELQADLASAQASLQLRKTELAQSESLEARMQKLAKTKAISKDQLDDTVYAAAAARSRIAIAEANISKMQALLAETTLIAPFDAVIIDRQAEIGQLTQPGEPLFVLEDQSQLEFKTTIKEQDLLHIAVGEEATVTIDALGGLQLTGQINKIIPSADPVTHAFTVEITLPQQDGLYPGMFGKANFRR